MKLVDILARELTEWPSAENDVKALSQARDGELTLEYEENPSQADTFHDGSWDHAGVFYSISEDCLSAFVTRPQWESARAAYLLTQEPAQDPQLSKIEKSMTKARKANKDGWIRHRGGKCPVEAGTRVDIRYRSGNASYDVEAINDLQASAWGHFGVSGDILSWRPATKEAQDTMAQIGEAMTETTIPSFDPVSLRQQWESLGHEIKSNECSIKAHQEAIAGIIERQKAIEAELKAAGFLIYTEVEAVKVDASEDMSDPKNWRFGDVFISDAGYSFDGKQVRLRDICESDHTFECEPLDDPGFGYWFIEDGLKFHSRP